MSDFLPARHVDSAILDNVEASIDRRLAEKNARRDARVSVPSAAFALELVEQGDLLATMPLRLRGRPPQRDKAIAAPAEIESLVYQTTWHPRMDSDSAHGWLRERVRDTIATLHAGANRE